MEKVPPYWGFRTADVVGEVVFVVVEVVGNDVLVVVVVVVVEAQDTRIRVAVINKLNIGKMYLPFIVPPFFLDLLN
jgi:hypothetical protein